MYPQCFVRSSFGCLGRFDTFLYLYAFGKDNVATFYQCVITVGISVYHSPSKAVGACIKA